MTALHAGRHTPVCDGVCVCGGGGGGGEEIIMGVAVGCYGNKTSTYTG